MAKYNYEGGKSPYCDEHEDRLDKSEVNRFYFDSLLVFWVMQNHIDWFNSPEQCTMCKIDEAQIRKWMFESGKIEAGVTAGGGTYTTDKMAVFDGRKGNND